MCSKAGAGGACSGAPGGGGAASTSSANSSSSAATCARSAASSSRLSSTETIALPSAHATHHHVASVVLPHGASDPAYRRIAPARSARYPLLYSCMPCARVYILEYIRRCTVRYCIVYCLVSVPGHFAAKPRVPPARAPAGQLGSPARPVAGDDRQGVCCDVCSGTGIAILCFWSIVQARAGRCHCRSCAELAESCDE